MFNKKRYHLIFACLGFLALLLVYYRFNPSEHSFFPPCPFNYFTGLDCPGCGSQRAIHALLHLHIAAAFSFNPLLMIALPFLIYEFAAMQLEKRGHKLKRLFSSAFSSYLTVTVVIVFWVLRNLA